MAIFRKKPGRSVDFRLGDGELLNRSSPHSFLIPTRAEREGLRPGDRVELLFEVIDPPEGMSSAERLWVQVLAVNGSEYVGSLDNEPSVITTVGAGSRVQFRPEHVLAVFDDWPMLALNVIVSRRSHEQAIRPRFIYRDAPMSPSDSGWSALIGDESPEELDDPEALLSQTAGFLLDRWPELRPVFKTDAPESEWTWDDDGQQYVPLSQHN